MYVICFLYYVLFVFKLLLFYFFKYSVFLFCFVHICTASKNCLFVMFILHLIILLVFSRIFTFYFVLFLFPFYNCM